MAENRKKSEEGRPIPEEHEKIEIEPERYYLLCDGPPSAAVRVLRGDHLSEAVLKHHEGRLVFPLPSPRIVRHGKLE